MLELSAARGRLRACLHEGGGPQVGEVTWGGLPRLTCKRYHIKMRDYTDMRVTSPIWGTPPPCKQVLNKTFTRVIYNSMYCFRVRKQ